MVKDKIDQYIIDHYRSMNQPEMATKLGVDKSTVSRRVARLKADGDIDPTIDEAARKESIEARQRLQGCAMSRADRLEALAELKDMLHAEIALSGGQSLARVSSEYRKTLEELESISTELDLEMNTVREIRPLALTKLKINMRREYGDVCGDDTVFEIVDGVLTYLSNLDIIKYTPIQSILSSAEAETGGEQAEVQLSHGLPITAMEEDEFE